MYLQSEVPVGWSMGCTCELLLSFWACDIANKPIYWKKWTVVLNLVYVILLSHKQLML